MTGHSGALSSSLGRRYSARLRPRPSHASGTDALSRALVKGGLALLLVQVWQKHLKSFSRECEHRFLTWSSTLLSGYHCHLSTTRGAFEHGDIRGGILPVTIFDIRKPSFGGPQVLFNAPYQRLSTCSCNESSIRQQFNSKISRVDIETCSFNPKASPQSSYNQSCRQQDHHFDLWDLPLLRHCGPSRIACVESFEEKRINQIIRKEKLVDSSRKSEGLYHHSWQFVY